MSVCFLRKDIKGVDLDRRGGEGVEGDKNCNQNILQKNPIFNKIKNRNGSYGCCIRWSLYLLPVFFFFASLVE